MTTLPSFISLEKALGALYPTALSSFLAHPKHSHKGYIRMVQTHCLMLLTESKFSSILPRTWPTQICYFSTAGWHFPSFTNYWTRHLTFIAKLHCSGILPHCVPYIGCYSGKLFLITLSSLLRIEYNLMQVQAQKVNTLANWPSVKCCTAPLEVLYRFYLQHSESLTTCESTMHFSQCTAILLACTETHTMKNFPKYWNTIDLLIQ